MGIKTKQKIDLEKMKVFAYVCIIIMLLFIFYFNYYIKSDASEHLAAVLLSKRYPDIFIFSPLAPSSIYHVFAYFVSDYINDPYIIVLLFSLISVPLLAYSIYLFLKSRNAYSFYFYALSFIISASFFTFHYMPAWAFSQIVFFFLLAIEFNIINAIISVPLFYITHPLMGSLYYGIRAIESFEKKEINKIYYAICGFLLLFLMSGYYIYINKFNNFNLNDASFIEGAYISLFSNLSFPYFTLYAVMAFALFFYLFKKNSEIRMQYLFLLSLFFIFPFLGSFFWINSRIAAPFIIYIVAIIKEHKMIKEFASFFSIIFSLTFLLIILIVAFLLTVSPNIKFPPNLIISSLNCDNNLTYLIINETKNDKLIKISDGLNLCQYSLLKQSPVFSYFILNTHPIKQKNNINDVNSIKFLENPDLIDLYLIKSYCDTFNDSISYITNNKNLTNIYKSRFSERLFIIKPCEGK